MAWQHLRVEDDGVVTRITLDRPEVRNALSVALMQELTAALRAAPGRVVVIAGAGPCFSAGHDLAELVAGDTAAHTREFEVCAELMDAVTSIDQPVVAEVHGVATAAGCQLVAACDLAVVRHARRPHRAVLLDADGAAVPGDRAQAGHADAPHRRLRRRRDGLRLGLGQRGRAA